MGEEVRPWGHYEILSESSDHKVKQIVVNAGARFSYQRHQHRSEHWFIVSGQAQVTHNGVEITMGAGDSIDIPQGDLHRLASTGNVPVVFIEVQSGSYFGEDDIERIEDDYSR
jgi:mannose-6-phosphate isomerase